MATQKDVGPTTNSGDKAAAAAMRTGEGGAAAAVDLDGSFPGAEIDPGVQKYVLIEATDPSTSEKVHFVRGNAAAAYHKDAARSTVRALTEAGWPFNVLGGGRINHEPAKKVILVYGHSYGFPWQGDPRHDLTKAVLMKAFPEYTSIEWSNEGY